MFITNRMKRDLNYNQSLELNAPYFSKIRSVNHFPKVGKSVFVPIMNTVERDVKMQELVSYDKLFDFS